MKKIVCNGVFQPYRPWPIERKLAHREICRQSYAKRHDGAGSWTPEQDEVLNFMFDTGMKTDAIAASLKRSVAATAYRLYVTSEAFSHKRGFRKFRDRS